MPAAAAAMAVDILVYPLDTIKSRVQAADYVERFPNRQGLFRGLWQGFGPVVLATLPSAAVFFTTYEHAKATLASPRTPYIGHILERDPRAMALAHGSCSALAELASCALLTPAETIKQQMQVARPAPSGRGSGGGSRDLASRVAAIPRPSFRSLWQGYLALAGRNLPFTAMQFPLYEQFRARISRAVDLPPRKSAHLFRAGHQEEPYGSDDVDSGDYARRRAYAIQQQSRTASQTPEGTITSALASMPPSPSSHHYAKAGLVSAVSASLAGAISALITTPLDLIKTRIMLGTERQERAQEGPQKSGSGTSKSTPTSAQSPSTIIAVGRDVWRREGLRGLMRGGALRSAWTALGAGIYLGSYEAGREWWGTTGQQQVQQAANVAEVTADEVRQQIK